MRPLFSATEAKVGLLKKESSNETREAEDEDDLDVFIWVGETVAPLSVRIPQSRSDLSAAAHCKYQPLPWYLVLKVQEEEKMQRKLCV